MGSAGATTPFFVYHGVRFKETKSSCEKRRSRFALLVSDGGAGWAGEVDDFKAFEAGFATPLAEVRAGIVERFAELDEHVQRHEQPEDILAAGIVDERFDDHERRRAAAHRRRRG